jgi:hypothetical protein
VHPDYWDAKIYHNKCEHCYIIKSNVKFLLWYYIRQMIHLKLRCVKRKNEESAIINCSLFRNSNKTNLMRINWDREGSVKFFSVGMGLVWSTFWQNSNKNSEVWAGNFRAYIWRAFSILPILRKKKGTSKLQRIISEERHLHFDPRSNKKVDTTLRMKASDYYNEHQENSNY